MINIAKLRIIYFFSKGHSRTLNVRKNILFSLLLKGLGVLVSFTLVPMTLNYLNSDKYGIWLTLSSIVTWFTFFDLGLGHGLRNKLAEAIADGKVELAKIYVSTTYAVITIIVTVLIISFYIINKFLNWNAILNASSQLTSELSILSIVIFTFFALGFVLKLIGIVLTADQRPAINNSFVLISNSLSLVVVYILTKTTSGSLLYLGVTMSLMPLIVLSIASFYFYYNDYKIYRPSLRYVQLSYSKSLFGLGLKFFIIELAFIVIFSTDNIIITHVLGPSKVTSYNVAFKYYTIVFMIFGIVLNPLWSAITEAYVQNDIKWIKRTINQLLYVMGCMGLVLVFMLIVSDWFYMKWVGNISIPNKLNIIMVIFIILKMWLAIYCYFLNGIGKVTIQLYSYIIAAFLNIPLSILFAHKFRMGLSGVMLATCVCLLLVCVMVKVQYEMIINNKAFGLWVK
jgi:O-antigen/teichoic acid export membrane protein